MRRRKFDDLDAGLKSLKEYKAYSKNNKKLEAASAEFNSPKVQAKYSQKTGMSLDTHTNASKAFSIYLKDSGLGDIETKNIELSSRFIKASKPYIDSYLGKYGDKPFRHKPSTSSHLKPKTPKQIAWARAYYLAGK